MHFQQDRMKLLENKMLRLYYLSLEIYKIVFTS